MSCSSKRVVLFFSDAYWASLGEDAGRQARELSAVANSRGYGVKKVIVGSTQAGGEEIAGAVTHAGKSVVVAGPLLSTDAENLAPRFPEVTFIIIDDAPSAYDSPNIIRLLFDRRDAFHTVGRAVGLILRGQPAPGTGDAAASLILVPLRSSAIDDDVTAFQEGVKEGSGGEGPLLKELDIPLDNAKVQKAVQGFLSQGVEIFFPRLGEFNTACLDAIKSGGGSVVTEDWEGSGVYADTVFLSVEEDIARGVEMCLSSPAESHVVHGPVRIVRGNALHVPEEIAKEIVGP
jgi:basic membrane lipoprotein Med (substrate-binding protein (PBP1-ABC) superfamily)